MKLTANKERYMLEAVKNGYPKHLRFIADMFTTISEKNMEDEFIKKDDRIVTGKLLNGEEIMLDDNYGTDSMLYTPKDPIVVTPDILPNVKQDIETTVGRLIMNYLLLALPFGSKIEYINRKFSIEDIEDQIVKIGLVRDDDPESDKKIKVSEYVKFVDHVTYIKNFNRIYSLSATEHTITPPPDIDKKKKEIIQKYIDKYGPKTLEDKGIVAEIENEISKLESEYIKNDKAYGKLVSGKVLGARKKMFVSYGLGMEFKPSPKAKYVPDSLYEGYSKDPHKLSILFNDSRLGSLSRGAETQKGGVAAKISLRATSDIAIKDVDCGTKIYIPTKVTDENKKDMIGRYYFDDNGKTILITHDNVNDLIGKVIKLRTPMTCKLEHHFCKYCLKDIFKDYKNGLPLMVTDVSGAILNESMKKMHNTTLQTFELEIDDIIS